MKRQKVILLTVFVFVMVLTGSMAAMAAGGFTDVPENAYYADAVTYVSENGLLVGTALGNFLQI